MKLSKEECVVARRCQRRFGYLFLVLFCTIVTLTLPVHSYSVGPGTEVHQKITQEAGEVWTEIPDQLNEKLRGSISTGTNTLSPSPEDLDFTPGDNLLEASAEEDVIGSPLYHFWDPDEPQNGEYGDGLFIFTSSYRRAREYWLEYVIPYYTQGDHDRSYYWLGRVAHLLEDAAVPAHVHLDQLYQWLSSILQIG